MKLFLFCFFLMLLACEKETKDPSFSKKDLPLKVLVEEIKETDLFESLAFGGTVEPSEKRGLYAKAPGVVRKIYPKLGDKIKKNQKLMQITPRDINFQVFYITAPTDGFFTEVLVKAGDHIVLNQKLGTLAKLEYFETSIEASLKDLRFLKVGLELHIILAEYTTMQQETKGFIKEISPVADPLTGTFRAKISIECSSKNPCYQSLKAGTYLKVFLKKNLRKGIKIPTSYLTSENKKAILLDEKERVLRVDVTLGKNYGDFVEILKGLSAGDIIVISSSRKPKDGEKAIIGE